MVPESPDECGSMSREDKLQAIHDKGRAERHEIYELQWGNVMRTAAYLTEAVSSLPDGDDKSCVEQGIRELIDRYDGLLLHLVGSNSAEFADWFSQTVKRGCPT